MRFINMLAQGLWKRNKQQALFSERNSFFLFNRFCFRHAVLEMIWGVLVMKNLVFNYTTVTMYYISECLLLILKLNNCGKASSEMTSYYCSFGES